MPSGALGYPVLTFNVQRIWDRAYAFVLALTVVGYPLVSAALTAVGAYSPAMSIAFRAVVLVLSVCCLLCAFSQRRAWPVPAIASALALWAALGMRFVWDAQLVSVPMDLPWEGYAAATLGIAFIPALSLAAAPSVGALDIAQRLIQVMGIAAAGFIALSAVILISDLSKVDRLSFDALNPITIGHLGVSLVMVSIVNRRTRGGMLLRLVDSAVFRVLCVVVGLALVVVSASKGPLLALVMCLLLLGGAKIFRRGLRRSLWIIFAMLILLVCSLVLVLMNLDMLEQLSIGSRLLNASSDQSTSIRLELMSGALEQFERSPLFGSAFVELTQRFYPHNILVEVLMTTGVFGAVALLILLVIGTKAALSMLSTRYFWLSLLYVQGLVSGLISGSLYFDGFFWGLLLVVCGASQALMLPEYRACIT